MPRVTASEAFAEELQQLEIAEYVRVRARAARNANIRSVSAACVCFEKSQREAGIGVPAFLPPELQSLLFQFVGAEAPHLPHRHISAAYPSHFLEILDRNVPIHERLGRRSLTLRIGWKKRKTDLAQPARAPVEAPPPAERAPAAAPEAEHQAPGSDAVARVDPAEPDLQEYVAELDFSEYAAYTPSCYQDGTINSRTAGVLAYVMDPRGARNFSTADPRSPAANPLLFTSAAKPLPISDFHPSELQNLWIHGDCFGPETGYFLIGHHLLKLAARAGGVDSRACWLAMGNPYSYDVNGVPANRDIPLRPEEVWFRFQGRAKKCGPERYRCNIVLEGNVATEIRRLLWPTIPENAFTDVDGVHGVVDEWWDVATTPQKMSWARLLDYCRKHTSASDRATVTDLFWEWSFPDSVKWMAPSLPECGSVRRSNLIDAAGLLAVDVRAGYSPP